MVAKLFSYSGVIFYVFCEGNVQIVAKHRLVKAPVVFSSVVLVEEKETKGRQRQQSLCLSGLSTVISRSSRVLGGSLLFFFFEIISSIY